MLGLFSECIKFFGGMIAGILMLVLLMKFPVIVIGCFVILFLYIRGKACGFLEAAKDIGGFILPFVFWGGVLYGSTYISTTLTMIIFCILLIWLFVSASGIHREYGRPDHDDF